MFVHVYSGLKCFSSLVQLDNLSQQELASRLTLNCMNCYVEPQKLAGVEVTILDVSTFKV